MDNARRNRILRANFGTNLVPITGIETFLREMFFFFYAIFLSELL